MPISKIISRYYKSLANVSQIIPLVDRAYIYDNSVENAVPQLLFRTVDGSVYKRYVEIMPEWAQALIP